MMSNINIETLYTERYAEMNKIIEKLKNEVNQSLKFCDDIHIDQISCRVKAINSFLKKTKNIDEDGNLKYKEPFVEIEDQIGVRVVVFYLSDVKKVADAIQNYFTIIENKNFKPKNFHEFAYQGQHFICTLPNSLFSEDVNKNLLPEFFEIQVKTLFQHAWSQAEHDVGYKEEISLDFEKKRKLAFTAAQAWGADKIFDEIYSNITEETNLP